MYFNLVSQWHQFKIIFLRLLSIIYYDCTFVFIDIFFFAGYGRFKNPDYRIFLALLEETRLNNNEENKVFYINTWLTCRGISDQWIYSNFIGVVI